MKHFKNLIHLKHKTSEKTLQYIVLTLCLLSFTQVKAQNFLWAKAFGKASTDESSTGIVTDASGAVYTLGNFSGTIDFDPGSGTYNLSSVGSDDAFIQKLAANGAFQWAISLGGKGLDHATCIKTDALGNLYVIGDCSDSIDLDPGPGVKKTAFAGGRDAFIVKLNSNGNYIWGKSYGGLSYDLPTALALDARGNPHTIGNFNSQSDMNPGSGVYNVTAVSGYRDVYIQKLDSSGNFVWARSFGGGDDDNGAGIGVDARGNVYTTGDFWGPVDFDPGAGTYSITAYNYGDAFVHKLNSNGNFVWAKNFRTTASSNPRDLVIDKFGGVYSTGYFNGAADFDPGSGGYSLGSVGDLDTYISKLDSNGNFAWAKAFGSVDEDIPFQMAIDKFGSIYTIGYFQNSVDFISGAGSYVLTSSALRDVFIHKVDLNGNFLWVRNLKGTSNKNNEGTAITIEPYGDIYSTGGFESSVDFDPGSSTYNLSSTGAKDFFVLKLEKCSPSYLYPAPIEACNSFKSSSGKVYTISGSYFDTFATVQKCDSLIFLNITIKKSSKATISVSACNQYTSPSKKYKWTTKGTYQDTIPNKEGCDSAITIVLTIRKTSASVLSTSACNKFTSPSNKYTWTSSGTYKDTITNKAGCDSFIQVNLMIRKSSSFTHNVSACKGSYGPGNKHFYSKAGTYYDTLVNVSGCDSFVTTNLTLLENTGQLNAKACKSFRSPSNKYTWSSSGFYTDTVQNIHGCDSIIDITLQIQNSSSALDTTTCSNYTSPSKKYTWFNSGQYLDTLINKNGCDSVISINLNIINIDTGVTQVKNVFTANMLDAEYQWINCTDSFIPVPGATNRVFEASQTGSYAVKVSKNSCSGTSPCRLYAKVGMEDTEGLAGFNLYPVPAGHSLSLSFGQTLTDADVSIFNASGQLVKLVRAVNGEELVLDIALLPPGFYIVKIECADQVYIGRMTKD